jgi:hypothetical protein
MVKDMEQAARAAVAMMQVYMMDTGHYVKVSTKNTERKPYR